jgi:hypothetical protein
MKLNFNEIKNNTLKDFGQISEIECVVSLTRCGQEVRDDGCEDVYRGLYYVVGHVDYTYKYICIYINIYIYAYIYKHS